MISEAGLDVARTITGEMPGFEIVGNGGVGEGMGAGAIRDYLESHWGETASIVVIGAMGICVRMVAPFLKDKHSDPAVICIDTSANFVIPVASGHIGGANALAARLASILGATPVITTQSDSQGLWAIDLFAERFGWRTAATHDGMNRAIFAFVSRRPTLVLLEVRDGGTDTLERSAPPHVRFCYDRDSIDLEGVELLLVVTFRHFDASRLPEGLACLVFNPPVLHLGFGCRRLCDPAGIPEYIGDRIAEEGYAPLSVAKIATVEAKGDEPLLQALKSRWPLASEAIYSADELAPIDVPNPSEKPLEAVGTPSVAEASAILSSGGGPLLLGKRKGGLREGAEFTFALALQDGAIRKGHIEIVGAGPGDPDLISVRGRHFLERADLILYAGSLVPVELTACAKTGAVVRSSASLALEEQFSLMKEFYDRGHLVVRLHTGDPCIYGAIQEQMAFFDRYGMSYHITPGISSFQAAAAALRSQFTIPEKVQTIILTRGEGRTPMPEREQLRLLARSRSTMCIFLSADIVEKVQEELLQEYPADTPVAVCHKLTWREERIYRGVLRDLASIARRANLTLTTLLVVGDAIDNREGFSKLYDAKFSHLFRK